MKHLYFLFSILLLSLYSCDNPSKTAEVFQDFETIYFPSNENENQFLSDSITDLADFTTFAEYLRVAQENACNWKTNLISFEEENTHYNIKSYTECPERRNYGCYFSTIFLNIENNFIVEYNEVSRELSELDEYLQSLTSRKYNYNGPNQLKNLVITINYTEDVSITNFKQILIQIFQKITRIEESKKIHIPCYLYVGTNFMPPPPPPPFPKN